MRWKTANTLFVANPWALNTLQEERRKLFPSKVRTGKNLSILLNQPLDVIYEVRYIFFLPVVCVLTEIQGFGASPSPWPSPFLAYHKDTAGPGDIAKLCAFVEECFFTEPICASMSIWYAWSTVGRCTIWAIYMSGWSPPFHTIIIPWLILWLDRSVRKLKSLIRSKRHDVDYVGIVVWLCEYLCSRLLNFHSRIYVCKTDAKTREKLEQVSYFVFISFSSPYPSF